MRGDAPRAPAALLPAARPALPALHARGDVPAVVRSSPSPGVWLLTSTPMCTKPVLAICSRSPRRALAIEIAIAALWVAFRLARPADGLAAGARTPAAAQCRVARARRAAARPRELRGGRCRSCATSSRSRCSSRSTSTSRSYAVPILLAGGVASCSSTATFLRFFALELALRPVLARPLAAACPAASCRRRAPSSRCAGACSSRCRSSTSSPASSSSALSPTGRRA